MSNEEVNDFKNKFLENIKKICKEELRIVTRENQSSLITFRNQEISKYNILLKKMNASIIEL